MSKKHQDIDKPKQPEPDKNRSPNITSKLSAEIALLC